MPVVLCPKQDMIQLAAEPSPSGLVHDVIDSFAEIEARHGDFDNNVAFVMFTACSSVCD